MPGGIGAVLRDEHAVAASARIGATDADDCAYDVHRAAHGR